jgi:hypothetical protein
MTLAEHVGIPVMLRALEVLSTLGQAQTHEITTRLQGIFPGQSLSMGNYIQCAQNYGWITKEQAVGSRRPVYRCTDLGKTLAGWLQEMRGAEQAYHVRRDSRISRAA